MWLIILSLDVITTCTNNVAALIILHILKGKKPTFGLNSKIPGIPSHYLYPCSSERKYPTVKFEWTCNRELEAQDVVLASIILLLLRDNREKTAALLFTCVMTDASGGFTSLRAACHPGWRSFAHFHVNRIVVARLSGLWEKQHSKQVYWPVICQPTLLLVSAISPFLHSCETPCENQTSWPSLAAQPWARWWAWLIHVG